MSSPALIRQDDAKRLFAAASEVGFDRCEIIIGGFRMVFSKNWPAELPVEVEDYLD